MKALGAVLGGIVLVLLGAGPAHADDPGTITSYVSDYTVSPDGDLSVVETITVDFPDPRHGIYRTFVPATVGRGDVLPDPDSVTVEVDGAEAPTTVENRGDGFVVRTGDPDTEITGRHVYEIRFDLEEVAEGQLYWNTIGPDWDLPILSSEATVRLPGRATESWCAAGSDEPAACEGDGTYTVSYRTGRLAPGTPVTVQVDYELFGPDSVIGIYVGDDADEAEGPGPLGITTTEALLGAIPVVLIAAAVGYLVVRHHRDRASQGED